MANTLLRRYSGIISISKTPGDMKRVKLGPMVGIGVNEETYAQP